MQSFRDYSRQLASGIHLAGISEKWKVVSGLLSDNGRFGNNSAVNVARCYRTSEKRQNLSV